MSNVHRSDEPHSRAEQRGQVRPPPIQAIPPQAPRRSPLIMLFLVLLLGVGVYGGYYGYCRYKVGDLEHAMSQQAQGLHQTLMRKAASGIGSDDIRQAVIGMAKKAGVQIDYTNLHVMIEPMNNETMRKLPSVAQMGMSMAAKIPGEKRPVYVVGFQGRFYAKHGVASRYFNLERYTWFKWVKPGAVSE